MYTTIQYIHTDSTVHRLYSMYKHVKFVPFSYIKSGTFFFFQRMAAMEAEIVKLVVNNFLSGIS